MKDNLLIQNLFDNALVNPLLRNPRIDTLRIVSGYATAAMGFHHLDLLRSMGRKLCVNLIYGMCRAEGISKSNHEGFVSLVKKSFPGQFTCNYLCRGEAVHAKVYVFCAGVNPICAFAGSANYSQTAFLNSQRREVLAECSPARAYDFFKSLKDDTISCVDGNVQSAVAITTGSGARVLTPTGGIRQESKFIEVETDKKSPFYGLQKVTLSLLDRSGRVPSRSGLNWGQRPEYRRNPDQAYLPVRGGLMTCGFFPDRKQHFTVLTDDNKIIECVRAQDGGKAIHTPHDNSEIGRYIRQRIGIPSGQVVTAADLARYGRSSIDFFKIDDENYAMNFQAP